jgi:hypothetical protein
MELPVRAPIKTTMEIYLLSRSKIIVMITRPGIVTGSLFRKFYLANMTRVFLCYYWFHHTLKANVRIYCSILSHAEHTLFVVFICLFLCTIHPSSLSFHIKFPPLHITIAHISTLSPYSHFLLSFCCPILTALKFLVLFTVYLHFSIIWEI